MNLDNIYFTLNKIQKFLKEYFNSGDKLEFDSILVSVKDYQVSLIGQNMPSYNSSYYKAPSSKKTLKEFNVNLNKSELEFLANFLNEVFELNGNYNGRSEFTLDIDGTSSFLNTKMFDNFDNFNIAIEEWKSNYKKTIITVLRALASINRKDDTQLMIDVSDRGLSVDGDGIGIRLNKYAKDIIDEALKEFGAEERPSYGNGTSYFLNDVSHFWEGTRDKNSYTVSEVMHKIETCLKKQNPNIENESVCEYLLIRDFSVSINAIEYYFDKGFSQTLKDKIAHEFMTSYGATLDENIGGDYGIKLRQIKKFVKDYSSEDTKEEKEAKEENIEKGTKEKELSILRTIILEEAKDGGTLIFDCKTESDNGIEVNYSPISLTPYEKRVLMDLLKENGAKVEVRKFERTRSLETRIIVDNPAKFLEGTCLDGTYSVEEIFGKLAQKVSNIQELDGIHTITIKDFAIYIDYMPCYFPQGLSEKTKRQVLYKIMNDYNADLTGDYVMTLENIKQIVDESSLEIDEDEKTNKHI